MKKAAVIICFILLGFNSFSRTYFPKKYDTCSGLSQNTVKAIYQDNFGRLWISTFGGLSVYDGEEFLFIISPPFWDTWWFRFLAIVFIIIAVALITTIINRYRLKHASKIEKMKTKIAADLHDDIGRSLSSIAIFSQLAKKKTIRHNQQANRYLERIEATSRNLIDAMGDIVWSINPDNYTFEDAILKMEDIAVKLLEAKGIEVQIINSNELENINLPLEIRRNLLLIFKEMITNTAKHSNASKVKIEFSLLHENYRDKKIQIRVEDNGVGFDSERTFEGDGLKNLKLQSEEIDGDIIIASEKDKGSLYLFSLLIKK